RLLFRSARFPKMLHDRRTRSNSPRLLLLPLRFRGWEVAHSESPARFVAAVSSIAWRAQSRLAKPPRPSLLWAAARGQSAGRRDTWRECVSRAFRAALW